MKICFVVNVDWFFLSHRLDIAKAALNKGYEVLVIGEDTGNSSQLSNLGIRFINLPFSRSGTNVFKEVYVIYKLFYFYFKFKPDIVHHITMKPVIYGSLVASVLRINSVVNAISGLGYIFIKKEKSLFYRIILVLMKLSFRKQYIFIFQNKDDYHELLNLGVVSSKNKSFFIKGSGVDLFKFFPTKFPSFQKIFVVLPSRMLYDKGIYEFYQAALLLREKYYNTIEFNLVGMLDEENKSGISKDVLLNWNDGMYFRWLGFKEDSVCLFSNSHIIVLPSYREGMPKSLIEACAMGRAIITTDSIGCKDCVDEGINGLKVPVGDAQSLANAIEFLVNNPNKVIEMGTASRLKAVNEFDIEIVIKAHLEIYDRCH